MAEDDDYFTNPYHIRQMADRKAKARKAKGKPAKRDARALKLENWMKRNGYTNLDLLAKLGRDSWDKKTPEERTAMAKRTNAIRVIKRKYCQHMNHPPKLRKGGRHAGEWTCPSCNEPVSREVLAAWGAKKGGAV